MDTRVLVAACGVPLVLLGLRAAAGEISSVMRLDSGMEVPPAPALRRTDRRRAAEGVEDNWCVMDAPPPKERLGVWVTAGPEKGLLVPPAD